MTCCFADHCDRSPDSPEVVVHGLEEEFDVGFVQDLFEVRQGDAPRGHVDPDQVGGVLVLQVVDDPGLFRHAVPHGAARSTGAPAWRRDRQGCCAQDTCLSVYLSVYLSVRESSCLSAHLSLSLRLSVWPPVSDLLRSRCVGPDAAGLRCSQSPPEATPTSHRQQRRLPYPVESFKVK